MSRIYVASSWRNDRYLDVVATLAHSGYDVFDFRESGFSWRDLGPDWQNWHGDIYAAMLRHETARRAFYRDMGALAWCDSLVMVMPCGRSACAEFGWAVGQGKQTAVLLADQQEPELMFSMAELITTDLDEIVRWLEWRRPLSR